MSRVREQGDSPEVAPRPTDVVLTLVGELASELHSNGRWRPSLASSLDADLGFDSLTRLELLTRLRRELGEEIGAEAAFAADTVAEVLDAVTTAEGAAPGTSPEPRTVGGDSWLEPSRRCRARSLPELLSRLVERDPDFVCIRLPQAGGATELRVGELLRGARRIASGLSRRISVGEPVGIMLPTGRDFIETFFGTQLAGGIPVPLAPAARASQIEDHLLRQIGILDDSGAGLLVASREVAALARVARARSLTVRRAMTVDQLREPADGVVRWRGGGDEIALLQYTSGSTGAPKGVVLRHNNLLANLEAIARGLETGPGDVFVSWLPLYHDMGLIGGLLHPLYCGIPLVLMSPLDFLGRPELWVETIDRYRGTMTVAPNFAYEICQRRASQSGAAALDLSRWRLALNGAEPVSPATIDRFCERFGPAGFRREAMLPVYGLAENSLAVTFPSLGRIPRVDRVDREALVTSGVAEPVPETAGEDDGAQEIVSCGRPLDGVELRLVDDAGREVEEREIGRVQFRGSSATSGYYRDEAATRELYDGSWIDSGDLGYLADGELFLTGRTKDIIIHAGRNLSPHALEEAAGDVEGVRKGCVAAFGVNDAELGTERLILVAETRESDTGGRHRIVAGINEAAIRRAGAAPDDVCLVPPHTLLKTSSGKIRRVACRELYSSQRLERGGRRSAWRQILATAMATCAAWVRRALRTIPSVAYSLWGWTLVGVLLTVAWCGVMVLPSVSSRRRWARWVCRAFFKLAGVPITVSGASYLSDARESGTGLVVASNHASFLDSMILIAALDAPLTFVAKRAFERHAVSRWLMKRLGIVFVDQNEVDPGERLESWTRRVDAGDVLVVFVEGIFVRAPGLRAFKLGAFEVAARARRPVLPLTIDGSRDLLRDEQWWLRRTPIEVRLSPAAMAAGAGFSAAVRLRDEVRRAMVATTGEPDLERLSGDGVSDWSDDESSGEVGALAEGMR